MIAHLRPLWCAALLLAASCSTLVAPRTILAESDLELAQKEDFLAQWEASLEVANAFLQSEHNQSLPQGQYELRNDGMILRGPDRDYEVTVKKTTMGGLCATFGYPAQERSWGFVVGSSNRGPAVVANTFFYSVTGKRRNPETMAELILHETAHQVHDVGTLRFSRTMHYYWFSLFYGYDGHPDEAMPVMVDHEYRSFLRERGAWPAS